MRRRPLSSYLADRSGTSAVEFAVILPVMLLLMMGGYALSQAIMISRKVTITTRALADLTSQYPDKITASDLTTVLNASQQIIAPFDNAPLSMRLSEVTTDSLCLPLLCNVTVTWSKTVGSTYTALATGSSYSSLQPSMKLPDTSYILAEVTYSYNPAPVYNAMGPYVVSDKIFMLPRNTKTIQCSNC